MRKLKGRKLRQKRVRSVLKGTSEKPRLNVFRSNIHIYGSIIDDSNGKTLFSGSDKSFNNDKKKTKTDIAYEIGLALGKKAKLKKINEVVFDRAGYKYHGRIKAFAEGARKGGLKF